MRIVNKSDFYAISRYILYLFLLLGRILLRAFDLLVFRINLLSAYSFFDFTAKIPWSLII